MKQLILIASVLFSLISNNARAVSILPFENIQYRAILSDFEMGQDYLKGVDAGDVVIDKTAQTIKLVLVDNSLEIDCPKGFACINPPMANIRIIELPIVDQYTGFCGSHHYVAERDMRPVDGLKETITVVDHSNIVCRIHMEHQTEVEYVTENPWSQETAFSNMAGSQLRLDPKPTL